MCLKEENNKKSATNVLFGLKMAIAFRLPCRARLWEISEVFVLREELFGFGQKSCLCEKEVSIV